MSEPVQDNQPPSPQPPPAAALLHGAMEVLTALILRHGPIHVPVEELERIRGHKVAFSYSQDDGYNLMLVELAS